MKIKIVFPNKEVWYADANKIAERWAEETAKTMRVREEMTYNQYLKRLEALYNRATTWDDDSVIDYVRGHMSWLDLKATTDPVDPDTPYYNYQFKNATLSLDRD